METILNKMRKKRLEMVELQLIQRGIHNKNVITAMSKIPRELFVEEKYIEQAYEDHPLPIGENQTISQPYIVALMTELLQLTGIETVLEIGTGTGYQTAILAKLANEVFTIERMENLSKGAQKVLSLLGYKNIHYRISDGTLGWNEYAPYDHMIITAGANDIPPPLIEQLRVKGKIVIPLGDRSSQTLTVVEKSEDKTSKKNICGCIFVPLIGEYGW